MRPSSEVVPGHPVTAKAEARTLRGVRKGGGIMGNGVTAFLAQEVEIKKRVRQIEDLIREKNQLKAERDEARKKAKRLLEILRDVAFGEEGKARESARRALARVEPKLEKEAA